MRALIVDDSRSIRQHLRALLERIGLSCEEAIDGYEALQLLETSDEFDFMLLDVNMPRMSGVELLREIRAMHATQPDVVLLTADLLAVMEHDARELGVKTWLSKPVKDATVLAVVRKLTPDAA